MASPKLGVVSVGQKACSWDLCTCTSGTGKDMNLLIPGQVYSWQMSSKVWFCPKCPDGHAYTRGHVVRDH